MMIGFGLRKIFFFVTGIFFVCSLRAQLIEPYQPVHGGHFLGIPVPASPDPMVSYRWDSPRAGDSLQVYTLKPVSVVGYPQSSFSLPAGAETKPSATMSSATMPSGLLESELVKDRNGDVIAVRGKGFLRMDFGVESAGWLEFDSEDLPDSVTMSISEYNEPAIVNIGAEHPVKTGRPVKYGHVYRLELNRELYEGVRFGWIHIENFSKPWHIRNPRLVCQVHPVNYAGSFSCDDPLLTRIWYTGAYTVRLNLLQHYFGAILMERSDRQSWTGDAYPAQAAALAAFGNYDLIRENIRTTSSQDNGIASYPLYWVLSLIDYYRYSGDGVFFRRYIANADQKLDRAWQQYDSLPSLGFMGWDERLGAGFENTKAPEAQRTYRMLCIHAWKKMAAAVSLSGDSSLAAKYLRYAAVKTLELSATHPSLFGIHAVSEAVNAGLSGDPAIAARSEKWFSDRLNRLSYSPFNQYFIIQAMAVAGHYESALDAIRDCWGGQLRYGGTSFFEVYRPSWNAILQKNDPPPNNQCGYTSLAHPWGAGVTKWLSENILGIRPLSPGFRRFEIVPWLGKKLTHVNGEMPTPSGVVSASFDCRSGQDHVRIPSGLLAERIAIPRSGRTIDSIRVNGKTVWRREDGDGADGLAAGLGDVIADSSYIYLLQVRAGDYTIACDYGRDTLARSANGLKIPADKSDATPFVYPIRSIVRDSLLSGSWKKKYGKDGYELFGYGGKGRSLPTYVEDIRYQKRGLIVWDSSTRDSRVLMLPGMDKGRAAGIITKDPEPTYQTFTVDVVLKKEHPFYLSLYLLDWDEPGPAKERRRTAVELFDLGTLDILAPVEMVRDYKRGRYIRFRFDRSVRIRIDQVRGRNAAVSGIFFDPVE